MGRGGARWGAGRPASKGKVEACLRLDMRTCQQLGALAPGYDAILTWSKTLTRERLGSISFTMEDGAAVLSYLLNDVPGQQRVPVERTPCPFGGTRPWFGCPTCGARVAALYLRRGGFHCRRCAQLAYTSQSEDALDRAGRRQHKAEAKLVLHGSRPKRMHRATRDRLMNIIISCEMLRDAAISAHAERHGLTALR